MLMRAEALAGGRDVRNKGLRPGPLPGMTGRPRASPPKTLWDD